VRVMTSLLYKVLSISILLNLLVFNCVAALPGANAIELSMSKDISSSARVFSVGVETVYEYHYGKATVLIVVVNPNVLFSYRNVYVVLDRNFNVFLELSRAFHEQASISVADLYGRLNALRERLEASGLSNVDLRVEGLEYVVNLSGKPIDKVAEAVGGVFGDLNETIIVLDKRLFDLRQLYIRSGVINLFREPDLSSGFRRLVNEVAHSLLKDLANSSCFCYMGVLGLGPSVDDFPNPILLDISIPASYEKCRAMIERHVVELADSIRKYIPEDIPLYIDLYETSPPYCGIEYLPLPVSTVALGSVGNASTPMLDGGQGNLVLEPQGGHSLPYLAITALIPVLGVTAYLVVKRLQK